MKKGRQLRLEVLEEGRSRNLVTPKMLRGKVFHPPRDNNSSSIRFVYVESDFNGTEAYITPRQLIAYTYERQVVSTRNELDATSSKEEAG